MNCAYLFQWKETIRLKKVSFPFFSVVKLLCYCNVRSNLEIIHYRTASQLHLNVVLQLVYIYTFAREHSKILVFSRVGILFGGKIRVASVRPLLFCSLSSTICYFRIINFLLVILTNN